MDAATTAATATTNTVATLETADFVVIGVYFVFILAVGVWVSFCFRS